MTPLQQQTSGVTHHHPGFDLPDGVLHYANYNQQQGATQQPVAAYLRDELQHQI
jgi:hypothetical protein